ncbi:MAG: hypothetical protein HYZ34_07915, partial [Ignavibacteriae bacterium]|nr:hypothetical protein [Ignavibacteriota bacterium]
MKHLFIFAFLLFLILSAMQAQLPTKLNQQGFLTDTMGVPLNGIFNMTFNLYTDTTAGTLMFTQTIPGVPVNKGAYSVNLDVSTVSFNQQLWMETQVGASTLTPRIRLTDAPYAMNSLFLLGPNSEATGSNSIAGGKYNRARGANSVVVGGGGSIVDSNSALGNYNFIGGGRDNLTNLSTSTIAGGQGNIATGNFSTVGGGWTNTASGTESFVGGGQNNIASGDNSAATGGYNNEASGGGATVSGGRGNSATTNEAFIGGGGENVASGTNSTIGGGQFNKARGDYSSVLGGGGSTSADSNSALGAYATVAGGTGNVAAGDYSFAAGRNAKANYLGSFVWNSSSSDFSSTDTSQFLINASGGVGIGTTSPDFPFHIRTSSSLFSTKPSVLKIDAYSSLGYVDAWINFSSTS